jgi:hypothetical protein
VDDRPIRPRRIVTGFREDGTSYIARDEAVAEIVYPRDPWPVPTEIYRMWAADHAIELPTDGLVPALDGEPTADEAAEAIRRTGPSTPRREGLRVTLVNFKPWPAGTEPTLQDYGGLFQDTAMVVVQWVIQGELVYVLDDGSETVLRVGDCVIQNGAKHAYLNRTAEAAWLGVTVLPAAVSA